MSNVVSLTAALDGWFNTPIVELPADLRMRVEDEFWPMPWDRLSTEGRRDLAKQIDFDVDPKTEDLRQARSEYAEQRLRLEAQIQKWKNVSSPTALDLALKEQRLAELRAEYDRVESELLVAAARATEQANDKEPPVPNAQTPHCVGSPEWRRQVARKAADARHDQPGGSRDKQRQILESWASGKYSSKDVCAEQECGALGMSFSAARRALKNAPKPGQC